MLLWRHKGFQRPRSFHRTDCSCTSTAQEIKKHSRNVIFRCHGYSFVAQFVATTQKSDKKKQKRKTKKGESMRCPSEAVHKAFRFLLPFHWNTVFRSLSGHATVRRQTRCTNSWIRPESARRIMFGGWIQNQPPSPRSVFSTLHGETAGPRVRVCVCVCVFVHMYVCMCGVSICEARQVVSSFPRGNWIVCKGTTALLQRYRPR